MNISLATRTEYWKKVKILAQQGQKRSKRHDTERTYRAGTQKSMNVHSEFHSFENAYIHGLSQDTRIDFHRTHAMIIAPTYDRCS